MTFISHRKDVKIISGYFLATDPSDASNECDDDDDENDDDDDVNNDEFDNVDFSEDKAFSPETHVLKPNAEKQRKVRFKEYGGDTVHEIYGHFPLTDPWWSASLRVRSHQKTRHLVAICGYRLRNDEFVAREKVVMLFLQAKKVHDDHRVAFEEYLRLSSSSGLTFENLHDQLQAFADADILNKEIAKQIQERVKQDDHVQNARRFRKIYEILPQLLPKHFFNIIQLDVETLDNLENALSVQPWVFGFKTLLTRFHNLHGCEASFKNFYHCSEVYDRLLDVEKDGLFIYGVLTDKCRSQGHTFVELWSLKKWKIRRNWTDDFLKYSVVDWNKGLLFLETHRIIVLNEHQRHPAEHLAAQSLKSDTRVYLSRFYFAERDIAVDLENLMFRGTHPKCDVQIDFESEHFERLRADEDQMKAAELIATRPVVVLSGKGGCGKTEVVGRVFSYARKTAAQERLFNHDSLTDEELVESVDKQMSLYYAANTQHHLDYTKQESPSTSNCVFGNDESYRTSDVSEVNSREIEAIVRYPPTQNYIKQEEMESIVTLGGTQDDSGNDLTETQDNSTASTPIPNHIGVGRILLTAPTGKAAVLLGRRSGMQGYTLHQVVYSYFAWKRNLDKAWKPNSDEARKRNSNDAWKFESVQVLIVDECSLVPVTIFQRVLKALLADAQLSKVVLLGDVHQLPSIEPGRFLADVYEALKDAGCSINLRTNHRSESQFIVDNAERILQQRLPIVNPDRHFHQINLAGNRDSEDNDRDEAVRSLLKGGILLHHDRSQFVAFRRKDCDGINELCCKHYNNHSMMKPAKKNGKQTLDFRPGDKVCCSRNAYVVDYNGSADSFPQPANSKDNGKAKGLPQIRLCNGEIFFIKQMHEVQERDKTICYVVLSDLEREIKVDLRELKNLCKLKHAWARTIHTFQGSETDALVYVVGSAGSYQNWQHVYTAVTRGKQQVHIITEPNCLQRAVMRIPIQRKTSLKERLQSMIATQLPQSSSHPPIQDQSKTTDVINSVGCNSTGETSASSASSLDDGLDFATPVKARPPPNQNLKSVSGGKRKRADPSVGCTMENSLADSLASPLKRKLTLKDEC